MSSTEIPVSSEPSGEFRLESTSGRLTVSSQTGVPSQWLDLRTSRSYLDSRSGLSLVLVPLHGADCIQTRVDEGDEEEGDVLWAGAFDSAGTCSTHLRYRLSEAGFTVEWRILNRSPELQPVKSGILVKGPRLKIERTGLGWSVYAPETDEWAGIESDGFILPEPRLEEGGVFLGLETADGEVGPRQHLAGTVQIQLRQGLGKQIYADSFGALFKKDSSIAILPTASLSGGKVSVLRSDGQEVNARVDLYEGTPVEFDFDSIGGVPDRAAVTGPDGALLFDVKISDVGSGPGPAADSRKREADPADRNAMGTSQAWRTRAAALDCRDAFRIGDFRMAAVYAEQQLLYNGDDPIAWWELAMARRLLGEDDSIALENAHFIAPLEPLLKAEGLLGSPVSEGNDAHPLVKSIGPNLPLMVIPALALIDRQLWQDAARWLEECSRVHPHPRLSLLTAWCWLNGTSKTIHAAQLAQEAVTAGIPAAMSQAEMEIAKQIQIRVPSLVWPKTSNLA